MKDCKNCTEKEALSQFAIEKANECAKLKAELAKAKDAICEAVYRSGDESRAVTPADRRAEYFRMRAEQLADQLREKDMELAQKDAKIRELEGILCYKPIHGADDLADAASRFFEALFCSADGNENGADA